MKMRLPAFTLVLTFIATTALGEIVIKPVRSGNTTTNRPGIVVPGPADSGFRGTRQKPQVLELLNGDRLQGTFVEFHLDTGATWRHPASKDDFKFDADSISTIKLNPRGTLNVPSGQNCTVKFNTGGELVGQLVEINKTHIILSAWYSSNSLRIPRENVLSIHPGTSKSNTIFQGPTGLEGWSQVAGQNGVRARRGGIVPAPIRMQLGRPINARGAWQYSNNSFVSTSSSSQIGRAFENLPDSITVEFDLSWSGAPGLVLYLFSDQLQQHKGNAYIVQINQSASCMMMKSPGNQSSLGNHSLSSMLRGKTKARFAVSSNRKNKTVMLTMNGKMVKKWTHTSAALKGDGKGIMFVSQTSGMMRISNLAISPWDGQVPKGNGIANAGADEIKDVIATATGKVKGTLMGLRGGRLKFDARASVGSVLDVPLEKINFISFAGAKPEKRELEIGDVRATLSTGGEFIFRLDRWTADRVSGMNSSIGRVEFDPAIFSAIQLNLNKKRGEDY